MAFMLEEVEVAQPLDLGVVHRVLPGRLGVGEAAAGRKIDADRQPPLSDLASTIHSELFCQTSAGASFTFIRLVTWTHQ